MKKLFLLAMISTLTACVAPVIDSQGKPVVIQAPTPAVIIDARPQKIDPNAPIHICKIKPFIDTYQSEHTNRAMAKLAVQKQCQADNDAMFCEVKDIECSQLK